MENISYSSELERKFAEKYVSPGTIDANDLQLYIRILGQTAIAELLQFMVENEIAHPSLFFNTGFRGRLKQLRTMPQGIQNGTS